MHSLTFSSASWTRSFEIASGTLGCDKTLAHVSLALDLEHTDDSQLPADSQYYLFKIRWLLCRLLTLLFMTCILNHAPASSFEVAGRIESHVLKHGTNSTTAQRQFTAKWDALIWTVTTFPVRSGTNENSNPITARTVSCEKNAITILEQFDIESMIRKREMQYPTSPKLTGNIITNRVVVLEGTIPHMDVPGFTAAIWIPYFSTDRIDWTTNQSFQSIFSMSSNSRLNKSFTSVEYFPNPISIVKSLEFFSVGALERAGPGDKVYRHPLKPPYDKHFTEAKYIVVETTNCFGKYFPLVSRIEYYKAKSNAVNFLDLELFGYVAVFVQSLQKHDQPVGAPIGNLVTKSFIIDSRTKTKSGAPTTYFTTNKVLEVNSPGLARATAAANRREEDASKLNPKLKAGRQSLLISVLAVLTFIFFSVVLFVKMRKETTKKSIL
jgi:hypothetical protein